MAENEILDIARSRHWRKTRSLLINAASAHEIAICLAEELDIGFRKALGGLRKGETLLIFLKAFKDDPMGLRAAVDSFKDKELARIARLAISSVGTDDSEKLAATIASCISDRVRDQTMLFALQSERYCEGYERAALDAAITEKLEESHSKLSKLLEASLRGERIKPPRSSPDAEAGESKAKTLASTSLIKLMRPQNHAQ